MKSAPSVCTDGEDLQEACRKETARLEKEKKQDEQENPEIGDKPEGSNV